MLDFQVLGTLGMMKAIEVIKGQLIFTRMVLVLEKFCPVMEKMLLPHCGDFCLFCFVYFI